MAPSPTNPVRGYPAGADHAAPAVRRRDRLFDLAVASALLVPATPVVALLMLVIRLESPGPALFRQPRLGRGGRPFELLKLRSMHADSDPGAHERHVRRLIRGGAASPWRPLAVDPRVTRVGRWLRATGLDELPQLVNVLRGDMRLVGPRPALPYEAALWQAWHFRRLAVPPGITGPWQVAHGHGVDFDTMVRMDLAYIERRSLGGDVAILARTPPAMARRWRAWRAAARAARPATPPGSARTPPGARLPRT